MVDSTSDHPLADQIQARHIATPYAAVIAVQSDEVVAEARFRLAIADITSAPVEQDGQVVGIFSATTEADAGVVIEYTRPLSLDLVVSEQTNLADLTLGLQAEPLLLLLSGRNVSGVVSRADLGKPAARTYFYLLLAELEVELTDALRARGLSDEDIAEALAESKARERAETRAIELKEQGRFIDFIACLSLQDLVQVAGKFGLREVVKQSGHSWRKTSNNLSGVRNDVMHPSRKLGGNDSEWISSLTRYIVKVRALRTAVRAWAAET